MKDILIICPNPSVDTYAWMEDFEVGVPNRINRKKQYPGGKGIHVAMALAEFDIPVTVAGFWGGETGQWIQRKTSEYYPKISFIGPKLTEWSRVCYTFKSQSDFDDTEILEPGPEINLSDFESLKKDISKCINDFSLAAICGSWPTGSTEEACAQFVELFQKKDIRTFIDCTGIQLENTLKVKPFGVHLNRKEISDYFQTDFETAKRQILNHCSQAAITDGAKGLYLISGHQEHHALAKIDNVLGTIGSGDCLLAGILMGHYRTLSNQEIANTGAAFGAANCVREELGMLHKKDVEDLLKAMDKMEA